MKIVVVSIAICIAFAPLACAQTGGYPASPSHTIIGTNPDGAPRYGSEPAGDAKSSVNTLGRGGSNGPRDRAESADRVDSKAERVIVGHGDGALAILDAATHKIIASAALKAHPENFQLDANSERIFVKLPNADAIDVIDRTTGKQIVSWPTAGRSANFAIALDQARQHVLVVFRRPAELGVFSAADGKLVASLRTCGDIEDVFVDSRRDRVYVSCGQGFIDVLAADGATYRPAGRIPTATGARTSLFVPELDRLLLAVPTRGRPGLRSGFIAHSLKVLLAGASPPG